MSIYADSNFFTRLYYDTPDSTEVGLMIAEAGSLSLPITRLHRLEVLNALEMQVFQSTQPKAVRMTPTHAAIAQATFREDCAAGVFLRLEGPAERAVDGLFEELVLRHTAARGFRTYDLLHVAQAMVLGCDRFWSFDRKASALAELEGLRTRGVRARKRRR